MKQIWTYTDLIDLEYCLSLDEESLQSDLHERDREIFLHAPKDIREAAQEHLVHHWLRGRRRQLFGDGSEKSPGQVSADAFRALAYFIGAAGIVLGWIAGYSFLAYSGTTPVNVLNFLFIFVFSQLLVMTAVTITVPLRIAGYSALPAPVVSLYALIASRLGSRLARVAAPAAHLSGKQRAAWGQLSGIWKKQQIRYRQAAYWPLFALSQYMMTGFNFGLLSATVYRLLTSDIAFGWQSTVQFSVEFIHKTVTLLAFPWSWIVPAHYACPSAAEIEGSRIILKDGIYHLTTGDLVSWWPFLVLCIIVYGLCFRGVLLLVGRIGRKRALQALRFNTPALIQLAQRMRSPVITSQAKASGNGRPEYSEVAEGRASAAQDRSGCPALLLIPEEMTEEVHSEEILAHVGRRGFKVVEQHPFMAGHDNDRETIAQLAAHNWAPGTGIAAVMESWMPPISETLLFFKELRTALGPDVPIWLILVGQSAAGTGFTTPTKVDRFAWQSKIAELGDPYLDLIES